MNLISDVEHLKDGVLIGTSNQFETESAIMKDNYSRLTLSYSSPLPKTPLIGKN